MNSNTLPTNLGFRDILHLFVILGEVLLRIVV